MRAWEKIIVVNDKVGREWGIDKQNNHGKKLQRIILLSYNLLKSLLLKGIYEEIGFR